MFRKVLVANRGEIAVRIIRACRELGVATVAVYSDADREAAHVGMADEAFRIGPARATESYLDPQRLLDVALASGCDALHPGYGFFAENAEFARRCAASGFTFIGPSPSVMDRMGGKLPARQAARDAGVPVVPGTDRAIAGAQDVRAFAKQFGYPVAIKASAGGGGKGLRIAHADREIEQAIELASREAAAYFRDATLYAERYLARPKHVEVQVLGDKHGAIVHLGERDCSMQRRHQKLVEETPANIGDGLRGRMLTAATELASSIGYDSAGTIECLVEGDDFYFLEMNTRIQVEHTITEATWGLDLVKAQIRIAAGEPLWFRQRDLASRGHAIECRINAESPAESFRPCAGRIAKFVAPAGPGIRLDSAAFAGWVIPQEYDSLIAKLVAWGQDRDEARARMLRALAEFDVQGVDTTIPFLAALLAGDAFARSDYATPDVELFAATYRQAPLETAALEVRLDGVATEPDTVTVEVNDKRYDVRVFGLPRAGAAPGTASQVRRARFKASEKVEVDGHAVTAPMHGIVAEIRVNPGDEVRDGQVVAIIEAMKMMNEVVAHRDGIVASVGAGAGETVEMGSPIITIE
jgi:acetyl-CoA/propionyl-CoA carboxylase biotin carboxyl carrier protein